MSLGPRIVFARFAATSSRKLVPWVLHLERLGLANPVTEADGGAVIWQLVSANNRQIARCAGVFPTFESAFADAHLAVADPALAVELVSDRGSGVFGWYATDRDAARMTCARWYVTERDRRQSIAIALRSLASAEVHEGVRLLHPALLESAPVAFLS